MVFHVTHSMKKFRFSLLKFLAITTTLGLASKLYVGPFEFFVRGHVGGILYVMFWIFLVLLIWPNLRAPTVATCVLSITCILEVFQLWQTPVLAEIRSTFLGHALIGSTFSWWDFPNYVLGSIFGIVFIQAARLRATSRQLS